MKEIESLALLYRLSMEVSVSCPQLLPENDCPCTALIASLEEAEQGFETR
jgi:hypothetical protein